MRKHFADSGPGRRTSMTQAADQSITADNHIADSGGHAAAAATVDVTSIAAAALALGPS